ncbi:cytochrome c-type biogenesis protein CcmH/NrfF [Micromonospora kangleipakensis]|uniref:Cytochrome c-type biogenesis protein n=1 Tax=Micromonospora kangleipakensis TaxID=1077942 RepID=A0A4Q8BDP7_9ACTN|nr:cytochrome c-type biogenesis protein CcmH [Micromonospora kangleipakensis]RZU75313.1 cytochrome c-type biogenesis protein CcmH/NrfF [Micromonospora kangleipakensis]
MRWRPAAGTLVLVALLAAAAAGLARSAAGPGQDDPVRSVTADLRCPACQGESVADSRSPMAAAMRQAVADQVAQGRSRDEVRRWFVQRYGPDVLADPPARGVELLLWAVPALTLLAVGYAARRTLRPRPRRTADRAAAPPAVGPAPGGAARWAWRWSALGLITVVVSVAVAARGLDRPGPDPTPADPVTVAVGLARDLEAQDRYDAAAQMYREALRDRPDDTIRLRLAFALLRAGDAAGAGQAAQEVLSHTPDSPDGLLVLGLAQRRTRPAEAPRTLRRFLTIAPEHPAAPEITRLLTSHP